MFEKASSSPRSAIAFLATRGSILENGALGRTPRVLGNDEPTDSNGRQEIFLVLHTTVRDRASRRRSRQMAGRGNEASRRSGRSPSRIGAVRDRIVPGGTPKTRSALSPRSVCWSSRKNAKTLWIGRAPEERRDLLAKLLAPMVEPCVLPPQAFVGGTPASTHERAGLEPTEIVGKVGHERSQVH